MKNTRRLLLILLLAPWLSLPLIGRENLKRFLPAALFISLLVRAESVVAKKRVWWWFYKYIHPKVIGETPLIWGPFLIGSMWILRLTYGKFLRYMALNILIDSFFVYSLVNWMKKAGIASLVRLKNYQLMLLFIFKSIILYTFQLLKESLREITRNE